MWACESNNSPGNQLSTLFTLLHVVSNLYGFLLFCRNLKRMCFNHRYSIITVVHMIHALYNKPCKSLRWKQTEGESVKMHHDRLWIFLVVQWMIYQRWSIRLSSGSFIIQYKTYFLLRWRHQLHLIQALSPSRKISFSKWIKSSSAMCSFHKLYSFTDYFS